MNTARTLLAVLSLAALAACGNDSITAPGALAPGGARYETAPPTGDDDSDGATTSEGETPPPCDGTVSITTDSSGNVTYTCVVTPRGGQLGSGG